MKQLKLIFFLITCNLYCQDGYWLTLGGSFNTYNKNSIHQDNRNNASISSKISLRNYYSLSEKLSMYTGVNLELQLIVPKNDELHFEDDKIVRLIYLGLDFGSEYKFVDNFGIGANIFYQKNIFNKKANQDNYNLSEANYSGYLINLTHYFKFYDSNCMLIGSYGQSFSHLYNIKEGFDFYPDYNYSFSKLLIYQIIFGIKL